MNDADEIDRQDRTASLATFAGSSQRELKEIAPTEIFAPTPADRVFGAQRVAVYRDDARVLQKLKTLAQAAGDDWYYRFPVSDGGRKTYIEGPSIKLANDLWRIYGNCDVDTRVFETTEAYMFYARFIDIESGASMTRAFRQRKSQKVMKTDPGRAEDMIFQIGQSKAIRNVVVNALQTYSTFAFEEARSSLVEKIGRNLEQYRAKITERLASVPIELQRVEMVVGRPVAEWLAPDVARVLAMMKAISDGMASVDETFPRPTPVGAEAKTLDEKLDILATRPAAASVGAQASAAAESKAQPSAEEPIGATPRDTALDKLRGAATNGKRALREAQAGLSPAERDAVTNEDWVALNSAAEAADKSGGAK